MARKRFTDEDILNLLRQIELSLAPGTFDCATISTFSSSDQFRRTVREVVNEDARVIYIDGFILARVADHSETGAKLILKNRTNLPSHFKVEASIYSGQVEKVWQRGKAIGVRKQLA
ncbi:hypothetical protein [Parvularcula sp. IMCC14364]|uniref:hypothetical protein n=1 Tax=Parvularcula sp. IMCC14364 TaxID=3067902 RepID=UPI0027420B23|nr:hypothetical protein [Parvularcula sp. IMCC14364]